MRKATILTLSLGFFLCFNPATSAQNAAQREVLLKMSEQGSRQFAFEKAAAVRLADSLGWPVRQQLKDGRIIELLRIENGKPVYYTTYNANGAELIHSDKVYPGGTAGLSLSGAGQTLGIWDGGAVRLSHQEFGGRVTQADDATELSIHATHVAGTMIASGVQASAKGMSYQASLLAHDWNDDDAQMATAAAGGLKVSQHSYGFITGWAHGSWSGNAAWHWFGDVSISETEDYLYGFYNHYSRGWDEIAHNAPHYLIVKSAGNDRGRGPSAGTEHYVHDGNDWVLSTTTRDKNGGADGFDCISHKGLAKNIMTVGAVWATTNRDMASFSSWGPTDDGRVKPDIVAKGVSVYSSVSSSDSNYSEMSGTSMSGPMVSGSVGLLLQHQENLHPGVSLLSSTMKALILHSADDMISGAPGPDYRYGWGLMDTEKAAAIMSKNATAGGIHIYEISLNNGGQISFQVKATGGEPLRATIVWTDVPGTPVAASLNPPNLMLVNDLDMRLTNSINTTYEPWVLDPANPANPAGTGDNFRDNVEMIHVESPGAEEIYTLTVTHKGTLDGLNQTFSLIITGNEIIHQWVGESSQDWFLATNWSTTQIPAPGEDVFIPGAGTTHLPVIANGLAECNNLIIKDGASLLIAGSGQLSVNGVLANESSFDGLVIDDGGTLLHQSSGVAATMKHNIPLGGWHFLSAPVSGQTIIGSDFVPDLNPLPGTFDFYFFDESEASNVWINVRGANAIPNTSFDETFVTGKGYLVAYSIAYETPPPFSYQGLLHSGEVLVPLGFTSGTKWTGWNLIGNPYPSGIDWSLIEKVGIMEDNYAYIYDTSADNYIYQDGGIIAANQGFFVKADGAGKTLSFSGNHRVHGGTYVKHEASAADLVLELSGATHADKTSIRISAESSFERDREDALKLFSFSAHMPQLYSHTSDGQKVAIQSMPHIDTGRPVQLGMHIPSDGTYRLSATTVSEALLSYPLYLKDLITGDLHNLKMTPGYSFHATADDEPDRFLLYFTKEVTSVNEDPDTHSFRAWYYDQVLHIDNRETTVHVAVYDLSGRKLRGFTQTYGQQQHILNLSTGIYVVQITGRNSTEVMKVLVR